MDPQDPIVLLVALLMALGILILILLVVCVVICIFLHILYNGVPEEFRKIPSWMVWLLLVPILGVFWNFSVFPNLSRSYQAYFEASGDMSAGTCYSGLAWTYAILSVLIYIPGMQVIVIPAGFVVLIIYLVLMFRLKGRIGVSSRVPG